MIINRLRTINLFVIGTLASVVISLGISQYLYATLLTLGMFLVAIFLPTDFFYRFSASGYVIFIVLFPKAGFKFENMPIIGGTIFLGLLMLSFASRLLLRKVKADVPQSYVIAASVYFFGILIISCLNHGITASLVNFIPNVLPMLTVPILLDAYRDDGKFGKTFNLLFGLTVLYGLIQLVFGHYQTAIPGLTVNYTDYQAGNVFESKNNLTSLGLKLGGTFQNGNLFGGMLIAGVLLTIGQLSSKKINPLYGTMLLIGSGVCLLFTLSRSADVGLVAGLFVFSLFFKKFAKYSIVIFTFAIILIYAFGLDSRIFSHDVTAAGRTIQYQMYGDAFSRMSFPDMISYLLFGKGFGYAPESLSDIMPVESSLLNLQLYSGIIGVFLFILPVLYGINRIRRIDRTSSEYVMMVSIVSAAIGMGGQMTIDQLLNLPPTGNIYWMLFAWMLMLKPKYKIG